MQEETKQSLWSTRLQDHAAAGQPIRAQFAFKVDPDDAGQTGLAHFMIKTGTGAAVRQLAATLALAHPLSAVTDEMGGVVNIGTYDVYQSNGVINVTDTVLMPK